VLDHMYASLFSTCGWILRLAVTVALLMSIHPVLALLAVFGLPVVFTCTWRPGVEREIQERAAPDLRLAAHLFGLATTAPPGKEVRVTRIGDQLVRQRREAWERWYRPVGGARWSTARWHTLTWAIFGAGYVGAVIFVSAVLKGTPGQVLLVLAAGARLSAYIGATVGEIGFLRGFWLDGSRRMAWLEDYAASLMEHADAPAPERLADGIRFEHVSFTYPGTERRVLDDINLELKPGAVVAIVGENGAGKSTLVKLLCRMYQPDQGRILIDGQDLARIRADEWRLRIAGAFQDFFRCDVVEHLASGLETQLGTTWPAGVEVSFGQWQKLALARGFMRDRPLLLVLDEPTAALDAETEHALFERYAAVARGGKQVNAEGRITILVSHRFSTVRMADLIVVLDGARVAEVGTHEALIAKGGQYAELYGIQAAAYR
jgi:ATP-binding cassette, subfamily B, bacterial